MERLKSMKNTLMCCVEGQLSKLDEVDTHELGEAIDMIKDLEQAMYYHASREQIEESGREKEMALGKMYYREPDIKTWDDWRTGRSPRMRKTYMESKEMHKDAATRMHDLEKYLKELSEDITEMIADATPEERRLLQEKLTTLSSKM